MSEQTRREFLSRTVCGAATAGAAVASLQSASLFAADPQARPAAGIPQRRYSADKFAMELDGAIAGWVESAEGGGATADVLVEAMGPDHIQHKHLAGVKYEDITVNCGTGMSKGFYDWIKASLDKQFLRKNGAVIACDYGYNPVSRLEWSNALITEIGFPACDAASKDPTYLTVKIAPDFTRKMARPQRSLNPPRELMQKKWLPSNFRLQIAGCPTACQRANRIEAIILKIPVTTYRQGGSGSAQKVASHLEVPNLVVTTAESHADELYQWHEDFVNRGNNSRDKERGGTLEYLTPDLKASLFTLTFRGLGVFKVSPEKMEAGSEAIRRVKAEMYCEDIGFAYAPAALGA